MAEGIPPQSKCKEPRSYDAYLYPLRHLVENAFLHLKQWRGTATRYAKRASSFLAAGPFRCALLGGFHFMMALFCHMNELR
jgi:transposase